MTTSKHYNPLLSAFHELTTPKAFRWYGTQAKATATLAKTIAHYRFTTAQRLLSDSNPMAIAPAVVEPENAKAPHQEYAQSEAIAPEPDDGEAALSVGAAPLDDEDDTELRYWAELELPSILDEEYSPLKDDADDSAGAEAED